MLICIAYTSIATVPMSTHDLAELAIKARKSNDLKYITGVLFHNDGKFLQFIEGEEAAAKALLAKIKKDPRHRRIRQIYQFPIQGRAFANWGMALREIDNIEDEYRTVFLDVLRIGHDAPHHAGPHLAEVTKLIETLY